MRNLRAVFEVARQTSRLLCMDRLYLLLWLLMVGGGVLVFLVGFEMSRHVDGTVLFAGSAWWMLGTVTIPWTTSYLCVQAVHGDVEDRTFQYLFVRPVPRWTVLLGKVLAACFLSSICHAFGAGMLLLGAAYHEDRWPNGIDPSLFTTMLAALTMLVVGYAAIASYFAARCRRPLIWCAAFVIFGAMFLPMLPAKAGLRVATLADPVRRFLFDRLDPNPRFVEALWPSERGFSEDLIGEPLWNVAIVIGIGLGLALLSYSRAEYDSRERE
ncbi:MAG: ABC transporter permease subunit [Planctomycetota bacterium]